MNEVSSIAPASVDTSNAFIPAAEYQSPDVPSRERDLLWPRIWQMACREEDLAVEGDFVNYEILDDSILIVRTGGGRDDVVAYYNVCQHRGRRLRDEKKGRLGPTIACRFHGWQWTRAGEIKHIHFEEDFAGCPHMSQAELALPKVKLERWGGWWWINQDAGAESLLSYLGDVPSVLDPLSPETMRAKWWVTLIAPVNWKVVVEAFNEGYHSFATHNSRLTIRSRTPSAAHGRHAMFYSEPDAQPLNYRNDEGKWVTAKSVQEAIYEGNRVNHEMLMAIVLDPTMDAARRLLAETAPDAPVMDIIMDFWRMQQEEFAKRGVAWPDSMTMEAVNAAGIDWHIFPNSIVLPSVDGALWYRIRPNGDDADSCIFDIWSFGRYAPGEEPVVENMVFDGFEAFKGTNAFLEEDFANMLAVNKGIKSRGFTGARTNPVQEIPVANFHRVMRDYLAA